MLDEKLRPGLLVFFHQPAKSFLSLQSPPPTQSQRKGRQGGKKCMKILACLVLL